MKFNNLLGALYCYSDCSGIVSTEQVNLPTNKEAVDYALEVLKSYKENKERIPDQATIERLTVFFTKVALNNAFSRGLKEGTPEHGQFIEDFLNKKLGYLWCSPDYTHY